MCAIFFLHIQCFNRCFVFVKFFFGDNVSLCSPGYPGTLRSTWSRCIPPSISILKDFYYLSHILKDFMYMGVASGGQKRVLDPWELEFGRF